MRRDIMEPSKMAQHPRFEGANIRTAIGFKHVLYLLEEAVLQHFRECGFGPQLLFEQYGLCLEIVSTRARLMQVVQLDDLVQIEVTPQRNNGGPELSLAVQLFLERNGGRIKSLTGNVTVVLQTDPSGTPGEAPPAALAPFVTSVIQRQPGTLPLIETGLRAGFDEAALLRRFAPEDANAFVWKHRIPYFYCHYSQRIQHSGYVRIMEEIVERFLAARGISVRTMLEQRQWIPVVVEARVDLLREALMEETLYTVYRVEEILKEMVYTARMDCYLVRDGELLQTATGRITHGYGKLEGRSGGALVAFDPATVAALRQAGREHE